MAPTNNLPPASAVLRRALLVWGLGHIALGDRRGWLLALAQPLAIGGLIAFAALLIDGTRWMLVLPALLLLLVCWLGQAVNAHRTAIARGATPGGELQIALFLPLVVAAVSSFWLLGGTYGAPATVLRSYVDAWVADRPDTAVALFARPVAPGDVAVRWLIDEAYLRQRVAEAAVRFGSTSGIDPELPFNSLRFSELPSTAPDMALVNIEIVRRQRVETVLLGFIPTAAQQTVVVEQLGTVRLRALPAPGLPWLPAVRTGARIWRIDGVDIGDLLAMEHPGNIP